MKLLNRVLKIAGVILAVAGVAMIVAGYWEKLTTLTPSPKAKRSLEEEQWAREAADYADVEL